MSKGDALNNNGYGYAVARIKAMEHRLLDANVIQRLVEAEDCSSVIKVLSETSYAKELASKPGEENFDAALESEQLSLYREVSSFSPQRELVALCQIPYDFHNLKVLLKSSFNSKSGGKKKWDLLTSLGSIPVDNLVLAVDVEDYTLLPKQIARLIPECMAILESTKDPFEAEKLLDTAMYRLLHEMASALGYPGVMRWCESRIDGENLRNLARLRRFGLEARSHQSLLHEGGTFSLPELISLQEESEDSWSRTLAYTQWASVVSQIHEVHDFETMIVTLEKALDEHCLNVLLPYRHTLAAPENILAFLWKKELEVKNIRTIMVSKTISADKEQLRRLIRNVAA